MEPFEQDDRSMQREIVQYSLQCKPDALHELSCSNCFAYGQNLDFSWFKKYNLLVKRQTTNIEVYLLPESPA